MRWRKDQRTERETDPIDPKQKTLVEETRQKEPSEDGKFQVVGP